MRAFASPTPDATPVWLVDRDNWEGVKTSIGDAAAAFAERCGFKPKAGQIQLLPGEGGTLAGVLFGVDGAERVGARPVRRRQARDVAARRRLPFRQPAS